jgi:hypothetical protein
MAEDTPSEGDLPIDPLFGEWLNGSPTKGGAPPGGSGADDTRFMDAVAGGSDGGAPDEPAVESTPFSEAVFGAAALSGPAEQGAGSTPADVDSPFGATVVGAGATGHRRLTRPVAMASIVTLVGAAWLGVWVGISPGARNDLGDVLRTIPGGDKLAPASQQHDTASGAPLAGGTPSAPAAGSASPSIAGLNIGGVLQPALFQAGAVSVSGPRTIARHAPTPGSKASPGHGGVTVTGGGIPTPTPPVDSTGSPDPSQPGGWGTNPTGAPSGPSGTPTSDPPTTDPTTDSPPPTTTSAPPSTTDVPPPPPSSTDVPPPPSTSSDPGPTDTTSTDPGPTDTTTTDPGATDTGSPVDTPSDPAT